MNCPVCNEALTNQVCCEYCGVAIVEEGGHAKATFVPIVPGEGIASYDLTRDAPPGHSSQEHHTHGHTSWRVTPQGLETWHTIPSWSYVWAPRDTTPADLCVSATAVVTDESGQFSVVARRASIGDTHLQYVLVARPARRGVRIERQAYSTREVVATLLTEWCDLPAIQVGLPIRSELRVRGPTLEAWVNGSLVTVVHDAVLGTGGAGLMVSANQAPLETSTVRCTWFEVREVAA